MHTYPPKRYRKAKKTVWVFSMSIISKNPKVSWYGSPRDLEHLRNEKQVYASKELAMYYKRKFEKESKKDGDDIIIQVKPVTFDVYEVMK